MFQKTIFHIILFSFLIAGLSFASKKGPDIHFHDVSFNAWMQFKDQEMRGLDVSPEPLHQEDPAKAEEKRRKQALIALHFTGITGALSKNRQFRKLPVTMRSHILEFLYGKQYEKLELQALPKKLHIDLALQNIQFCTRQRFEDQKVRTRQYVATPRHYAKSADRSCELSFFRGNLVVTPSDAKESIIPFEQYTKPGKLLVFGGLGGYHRGEEVPLHAISQKNLDEVDAELNDEGTLLRVSTQSRELLSLTVFERKTMLPLLTIQDNLPSRGKRLTFDRNHILISHGDHMQVMLTPTANNPFSQLTYAQRLFLKNIHESYAKSKSNPPKASLPNISKEKYMDLAYLQRTFNSFNPQAQQQIMASYNLRLEPKKYSCVIQ